MNLILRIQLKNEILEDLVGILIRMETIDKNVLIDRLRAKINLNQNLIGEFMFGAEKNEL